VNGTLRLHSKNSIETPGFTSYGSYILPTNDYGYAIVYVSRTSSLSSPLSANKTTAIKTPSRLCVIFLTPDSFQELITRGPCILYQASLDSSLIEGLVFCDINFSGVGLVCTFPITQSGLSIYYLKVFFLSSGEIISYSPTLNLLQNANVSLGFDRWIVEEMPFGGCTMNAKMPLLNGSTEYYLYAYGENDDKIFVDLPQSMIANTFAASGITNNNTFLLAQPESNNSWTLLAYQLPKVFGDLDYGHNNLHVRTTSPTINGVILPTRTWQATKGTDCTISKDELTVTVPLIASTFNQPGKQYYVAIQYGFIKSKNFQEPLPGIKPGIWRITTTNFQVPASAAAVIGMFRLKPDSAKDSIPPSADFFSRLLQEIALVGIFRLSRLGSHPRYQIVDAGTPSETMLISIDIGPSEGDDDIDALGIIHYLNIIAKDPLMNNMGIDPVYGVVPLLG
ncbi:2703_t:CDS:2, partial [Acaulospora colombiana]